MSWLRRAIAHRAYFARNDETRAGVQYVHRWIMLLGGATAEWAVRALRDLDGAMQRGGHDGASGWGMFRNDVTTWLAVWTRDYARPSDREHLIAAATCVERYLGALGGAHSSVTAPLAARWREALERADAAAYDAFVAEAIAIPELNTLGAGGVLPLIEAAARVVDGATVRMSTAIAMPASGRSGEPLVAPFEIRIWARGGGEQVKRFDQDVVTIGRAETSDVWLDDGYAAREHARIERDGAVWIARDLRSDNRTFLFETPIASEMLQNKDVLMIGGNLLFVERCD